MTDTIERILSLIKASGLTDKQILEKMDVSSSSTLITDWRNGRSRSPQIKHIKKLSELFNVSTDYLLTGKHRNDDLSQEENDWLNLYRQLSLSDPDTKNECIGFVKGYIAGNKK